MDKQNKQRLEQLVRQGIVPNNRLPMLMQAMSNLHMGKQLKPTERDVLSKYMFNMTDIMLKDTTVFNRAKLHTQKTKYQTEETTVDDINEKTIGGVKILDGPEEEENMRTIANNKGKKLSIRKREKYRFLSKELKREKKKADMDESVLKTNTEYQELFEAALECYGVSNIRDLPEDTKAEFFAVIDEAMKTDDLDETITKQHLKMAKGIAFDKRYAGTNFSGAEKAMEKVHKGLSDHPESLKHLKHANEEVEFPLDEDYSKHSNEALKGLLQPGVLKRSEGYQKSQIKQELKRRKPKSQQEGAEHSDEARARAIAHIDKKEAARQKIKWKVKPPAGTKNAHPDGMQPDKVKEEVDHIEEAGMPSSVIKSKQRLADMSDHEFHASHGKKTDDDLQKMARRHGFGKRSNHYVNRSRSASDALGNDPVKEEVEHIEEVRADTDQNRKFYGTMAAISKKHTQDNKAKGLVHMKKTNDAGTLTKKKWVKDGSAEHKDHLKRGYTHNEEVEHVEEGLYQDGPKTKLGKSFFFGGSKAVEKYRKTKAQQRSDMNKKNDPGADKKHLALSVVDREKADKKAKPKGTSLNKQWRSKMGYESVEKATDKLANEEVQGIDELSKKTLGSYINKAADPDGQNSAITHAVDSGKRSRLTTSRDSERTAIKRGKGIQTAAKKLANEEVELTFEEMTPAQKAARIKVIAKASARVKSGDAAISAEKRAMKAAKADMKKPGARKGMAPLKRDDDEKRKTKLLTTPDNHGVSEDIQQLRKMIKENTNKAEAYKLLAKLLNTTERLGEE